MNHPFKSIRIIQCRVFIFPVHLALKRPTLLGNNRKAGVSASTGPGMAQGGVIGRAVFAASRINVSTSGDNLFEHQVHLCEGQPPGGERERSGSCFGTPCENPSDFQSQFSNKDRRCSVTRHMSTGFAVSSILCNLRILSYLDIAWVTSLFWDYYSAS